MDVFLAVIPLGLEHSHAEVLLGEVRRAVSGLFSDTPSCRSHAGPGIAFACTVAPLALDTALQIGGCGQISYVCGCATRLSGQDRERATDMDGPGGPDGDALPAFHACALAAVGGRPGLADISGSYCGLVHDPGAGRTVVATDRLGSRPVFVHRTRGLLCLSSDIRCLLSLSWADRALDVETLVQFVRLQTILEEGTLYRGIRVLGPATRLSIDAQGGEVTRHRYWRLARLDPFATEKQSVECTAETFRSATRRILEGSQRVSVLLSGGLDSRMLAACVPLSEGRVLQACTFEAARNDESPVARRVAESAGLPWMVVEQDVAAYWRAMPGALAVSHGLYSLGHMHTYLAAKALARAGYDTTLDGWGLDLPFSGSYLPKASLEVAGRRLYGHWLRRVIAKRQVVVYLRQVLDLQPGGFERSLLGPELRDHWESAPVEAVGRLVEEASLLSDDPYDWIDAVLFGFGIAKFRSYLMVTGIRAHLRERNPLFESDVLEVYQRLPHAWRFMGRVFRQALLALDPKLARIPYANTGTSPLASPVQQMLSLQIGSFLRANRDRLTRALARAGMPFATQRAHGSYPSPDELAGHLKSLDVVPTRVRTLLEKGSLARSGLIQIREGCDALPEAGTGQMASAETLLAVVTLALWCDTMPMGLP